MDIAPRIHVLIAQKSDEAVIIRRGPSKQTAVIGWNRKNDSFLLGQWLKGKIYHYRSDISPNGEHWVYFAMSSKTGKTWTAVAKTAYLKALDFHTKGDAWNGGGLFFTDYEYWLNGFHQTERKNTTLKITDKYDSDYVQGECPGVYFRRLIRDGWEIVEKNKKVAKFEALSIFAKKAACGWILQKHFHSGLYHSKGKSPYYEDHLLVNTKTGERIELKEWEWADIDNNRIVWAEDGKIWAGSLSKTGFFDRKELFDTTKLEFEELTAPY